VTMQEHSCIRGASLGADCPHAAGTVLPNEWRPLGYQFRNAWRRTVSSAAAEGELLPL
jgi:hypothetical protein